MRAVYRLLAIMVLPLLHACGVSKDAKHELVGWYDQTNRGFAIERREDQGARVLIPDVLALQTSSQFISGHATWKYIDGPMIESTNPLVSKAFWFVIDKSKAYEDCRAFLSTDKDLWAKWCVSNNVPTNLTEIKEFVDSSRIAKEGGIELTH